MLSVLGFTSQGQRSVVCVSSLVGFCVCLQEGIVKAWVSCGMHAKFVRDVLRDEERRLRPELLLLAPGPLGHSYRINTNRRGERERERQMGQKKTNE